MWTSELIDFVRLRELAIVALAVATFVLVHELALIPSALAPAYGARGRQRAAARANALFRLSEPLISKLAGWLCGAPRVRLHGWLRALLCHAHEPLGLSPDELLAMAALSCLFVGGGAAWLVTNAGMSSSLAVAALLFGAFLPIGRVRATARLRAKQLERSLPVAMDLCVLCMGAGADFPGALRFVVDELGAPHQVCREELAQVLDELALGRTRVEALQNMGSRTGSSSVREFVASICQSEEKGTPLIEALTIQSTTLRQRRTVRAEELAAQAGVKMMLPLMLLVCSLLLIVFGPIITTGMGL